MRMKKNKLDFSSFLLIVFMNRHVSIRKQIRIISYRRCVRRWIDMNQEYEYSFQVKDVNEFIQYCIDHNYEKVESYHQIRTLFKNGGKIMARITKNTYDNQTVELLNFKDDNLNDETLTVRRETDELMITDDNRNFVTSLIDILDLNTKKVLERNRVVYQKNHVKFEIDDYISPAMKVVAIEGEKEKVDSVYQELQDIIEANKII